MKPKYIIGIVVAVIVITVVGVVLAKHQPQSGSSYNRTSTANTVQATSQAGGKLPYPVGKIGDTFTASKLFLKFRLVQVAPFMARAYYVTNTIGAPTAPANQPGYVAKIEVTNMGNPYTKISTGDAGSVTAYGNTIEKLGTTYPESENGTLLPDCNNTSNLNQEDFYIPMRTTKAVCIFFSSKISIRSIVENGSGQGGIPLAAWDVK